MVQHYRTYYRLTYELKNDSIHFTCIWCWKEFDSGSLRKKYAELAMLDHYDYCGYFPKEVYTNGKI